MLWFFVRCFNHSIPCGKSKQFFSLTRALESCIMVKYEVQRKERWRGMKQKPELLAPAGNFEKLRAAVLYGADAVYLAGGAFGMRAAAGNFTDEELPRAAAYAHERGVRVYLAVNTMPRTY